MLNKLLKQVKGYKKLPYKDDFIRRLNSSVIGEGMMHKGNLFLFDFAIKNMPPNGTVLEIGSWGGLSANLILHLLEKYNRQEKLFTCDPWIYEGINDTISKSKFIDGSEAVLREDYSQYIMLAFINSINLLHPTNKPHSFRLTSNEFFEALQKREPLTDLFNIKVTLPTAITFCYIDGDHSYKAAKNDFENVKKHLLNGGYVLFDDSIDGSQFGSAKLMAEVKNDPSFKLVYKNPNYLFQKVKH